MSDSDKVEDEMVVDNVEDESTSKQNVKKQKLLKFRNYYPRDESLREFRLPPTPDIVSEIQQKFEELSTSFNEDDLLNLAPQKPNWDLKRDIAKKLEKLDALTRRAITDMIREKLQAQQTKAK